MSHTPNLKAGPDRSTVYRILVKGHLNQQWSAWFDGLTITQHPDGNTLITGPVIDQAALFRLLKKVRDLGLDLLAVGSDSYCPTGTAEKNEIQKKF